MIKITAFIRADLRNAAQIEVNECIGLKSAIDNQLTALPIWRIFRDGRARCSIASEGDHRVHTSRGAPRNQGRNQRDQNQ
jgi:hypothetical protein